MRIIPNNYCQLNVQWPDTCNVPFLYQIVVGFFPCLLVIIKKLLYIFSLNLMIFTMILTWTSVKLHDYLYFIVRITRLCLAATQSTALPFLPGQIKKGKQGTRAYLGISAHFFLEHLNIPNSCWLSQCDIRYLIKTKAQFFGVTNNTLHFPPSWSASSIHQQHKNKAFTHDNSFIISSRHFTYKNMCNN